MKWLVSWMIFRHTEDICEYARICETRSLNLRYVEHLSWDNRYKNTFQNVSFVVISSLPIPVNFKHSKVVLSKILAAWLPGASTEAAERLLARKMMRYFRCALWEATWKNHEHIVLLRAICWAHTARELHTIQYLFLQFGNKRISLLSASGRPFRQSLKKPSRR